MVSVSFIFVFRVIFGEIFIFYCVGLKIFLVFVSGIFLRFVVSKITFGFCLLPFLLGKIVRTVLFGSFFLFFYLYFCWEGRVLCKKKAYEKKKHIEKT